MMSDRRWSRDLALANLRGVLWANLSSTAAPEQLPGLIENLWQFDPGRVRELSAVHLLLSSDVSRALDLVEAALHGLPSEVRRSETVERSRIVGPVNWPRTELVQAQFSDPTVFVCYPPSRRYDSPYSRLLRLALERIVGLAHAGSLDGEHGRGAEARARHTRARRLLAHPELRGSRRIERVPASMRSPKQRRRDVPELVRLCDLVDEVAGSPSPEVLAEVLSKLILSPSASDTLFELEVGVKLAAALVDRGLRIASRSVLGSRVPEPLFEFLTADNQRVRLWWQRSYWTKYVTNWDANQSGYRKIRVGSGVTSPGSLRPDFLISWPDRSLSIVEVKLAESSGSEAAQERRGIQDVMAYLHDMSSLGATDQVDGLVVTWNAVGHPAEPAQVMVASQTEIAAAVGYLFKRRPSAQVA